MLSLAATRILDLLRQHGKPFVDRRGDRRLKLRGSRRELQEATGVSKGSLDRALRELGGAVGLVRHRPTRADLPGALSIPDPGVLGDEVIHKVGPPWPASKGPKVMHRGAPPDFPAEGEGPHPVMSRRRHGPEVGENTEKIPGPPVDKSAPNGWGMGGSLEGDVHHHPSGEGPGGPGGVVGGEPSYPQSGAPSGRRGKLRQQSYPQSGAPPRAPELIHTESGIFIIGETEPLPEHPPEVVESMARQLEGWGFTDALRFCRKYPLEIILEEMNEVQRELATGSRINEPGAVLRKRVKERCDG